MTPKLKWFGGFILAFGIVAAGVLYVYFDEAVPIIAMGVNYIRYMNAPKGNYVACKHAQLGVG
ncbi:MAG: hypothetical protein P4L76_08505 [Beijerinckiaceae bacterium]|nr:hypothetical protein [Beijerinckiaceae bacterium]